MISLNLNDSVELNLASAYRRSFDNELVEVSILPHIGSRAAYPALWSRVAQLIFLANHVYLDTSQWWTYRDEIALISIVVYVGLRDGTSDFWHCQTVPNLCT